MVYDCEIFSVEVPCVLFEEVSNFSLVLRSKIVWGNLDVLKGFKYFMSGV